MIILLDVPYQEKDLAKSKGAKWNPIIKTWFTDDLGKLSDLEMWINSFNVICETLYILKMDRICWKCGKEIEVVCLATNKSYFKENKYQKNLNIQLFSYVLKMPNSLTSYMKEHFLYFPSYSKSISSSYYVNHCKFCDSIQGDNFLHEVPSQAFYKNLCYKDNEPIRYAKISNQFGIPLHGTIPYYDEVSGSIELLLIHMKTEIENRASIGITQKLINKLFLSSEQQQDIDIVGL